MRRLRAHTMFMEWKNNNFQIFSLSLCIARVYNIILYMHGWTIKHRLSEIDEKKKTKNGSIERSIHQLDPNCTKPNRSTADSIQIVNTRTFVGVLSVDCGCITAVSVEFYLDFLSQIWLISVSRCFFHSEILTDSPSSALGCIHAVYRALCVYGTRFGTIRQVSQDWSGNRI